MTRHTEPSSIKTCVYHGQSRTLKFADLGIYDLVITTYGTLCAEWLNSLKRSTAKQSLLHQFDWFRIVLDEGR